MAHGSEATHHRHHLSANAQVGSCPMCYHRFSYASLRRPNCDRPLCLASCCRACWIASRRVLAAHLGRCDVDGNLIDSPTSSESTISGSSMSLCRTDGLFSQNIVTRPYKGGQESTQRSYIHKIHLRTCITEFSDQFDEPQSIA